MKKILPILAVAFIALFFRYGTQKVQSAYLIIRPNYDSAAQQDEEILKINNEIQTKKDVITRIKQQQEEYMQAIEQKRSEKSDLENQMSILENRIAQTELDIKKIQLEIDKTALEIQKTKLEIATRESEILGEKERIASILGVINIQDNKTTLEIMLLNKSFSDYVNQLQYLEDLNDSVRDSLEKLRVAKKELEEKNVDLSLKIAKEEDLKKQLEEKKVALLSERENKMYIIEQTELAESNYQALLSQARQEQEQASADIFSLERKARDKLTQIEQQKIKFNDKGFIWPVPKNYITSYFHDPDYPFRAIFEHPAVDIRAGQGTTLRASASGYVARARDAGMGYSYIMIIHGNGLSTVYGHVSQLSVSDDDYVTQGQVIGRTGGLPGTPGAGRLTTGPHLHFEVRLNGIPVNPLEYLP